MSTKDKIAQATLIIVFAAIFSKVLGFIRDIIIASKFGTSLEMDAFLIALAAPEFLMDIFAGSALTAAFIPVFSLYLARNKYEEASKIFSTVFNVLFILLAVIFSLCILNSKNLLGLIAPGFSHQTLTLAVRISYIVFPAVFFMGVASYMGGVLNATKHFFFPSMNQAILNVSIIASTLYLSSVLSVKSIAVGFLAGGVFQFLFLIPPILKRKFNYVFKINLSHPGIRKMGLMLVPLIIALILSSASNLVVKIFASTLAEGSITALHFAFRLKQLSVVIFGVSLATAIFPFLSWQAAEGNMEELKKTVTRGLKVIFFVTFPLCLMLAVFKDTIVQVLFERGNFTVGSTRLTATALLYYLPGALAVSLNYIIIKAYYALKDTKTLLKATALGLVVMVISGWLLKGIYYHNGLAMANSLADLTIFLVLFLSLSRKIGIHSINISFIKISCVSILAIIPVIPLFNFLRNILQYQIVSLSIVIVCFIVLFALLNVLLNIEEGRFFIKIIREKLKII